MKSANKHFSFGVQEWDSRFMKTDSIEEQYAAGDISDQVIDLEDSDSSEEEMNEDENDKEICGKESGADPAIS